MHVTGTESYFENFLQAIGAISAETGRKLISVRPFSKKSQLNISLDQYRTWYQVEGYRNILKLSCRPFPFTSYEAFLKTERSGTFQLGFFRFLWVGTHSMQCWTATKSHGVTRKRSTERLGNLYTGNLYIGNLHIGNLYIGNLHTGNLFRKNLQLKYVS